MTLPVRKPLGRPSLTRGFAGFVVVAMFLAIAQVVAMPVIAHQMQCQATYTSSVTIPPGTSQTSTIFGAVGPVDKTWVIRLSFGIHSQGSNQPTSFVFGLYQSVPLLAIGSWQEVANDWNYAPGNYQYGDTVTSHSGERIDLYVTIRNFGSQTTTYQFQALTYCI